MTIGGPCGLLGLVMARSYGAINAAQFGQTELAKNTCGEGQRDAADLTQLCKISLAPLPAGKQQETRWTRLVWRK